jgi:hypothetical protein
MPKPGGCHSSGISLGDALKLPKRHPAWRRREAQSGSRKKLTCSGHAANSRRYRDLGSTCLWLIRTKPNERPRCRRRAASLTSFHSLRVGNAGGRLVRNGRTWPAMPRAQAAPTARPKVLMPAPTSATPRSACSRVRGKAAADLGWSPHTAVGYALDHQRLRLKASPSQANSARRGDRRAYAPRARCSDARQA